MRDRQWFELLPEPYNKNRSVVVVMKPVSWRTELRETTDGKHAVGFLVSPKGTRLGLQVIDTDLDGYMEHKAWFDERGIPMADPAYIGPISAIPQDLLMDYDRVPLVFCRDAMWRNYLDLHRVWKRSELKC